MVLGLVSSADGIPGGIPQFRVLPSARISLHLEHLRVNSVTTPICFIGASLSEPHIDHDNVPRRGECLYLSIYISVLRKPWIWTIHGLSCANRGSRFERTNRGSLAQSVD